MKTSIFTMFELQYTMPGHPILRQFWQHFATKNLSRINWTKKTPTDTIQGSNMAPQGHPRTPNGSEMTPQIAPKSTLGAPRAPSGAPKAADVTPWHQKSPKSRQHHKHTSKNTVAHCNKCSSNRSWQHQSQQSKPSRHCQQCQKSEQPNNIK